MTQQIGGEPEPPAAVVGIALSGGGVRSAAFGLGALQALQKHRGLVHGPTRARFLSAVSGGSYTAAAVVMALGGALATPSHRAFGRRWDLADEGRTGPDGHPVYTDTYESQPLTQRLIHGEVPREANWRSVSSADPLRPGSTESDYLRVHARYLIESAPIGTILQFAWLVVASIVLAVSGAVVAGAAAGWVWSLTGESGWAQFGVIVAVLFALYVLWIYGSSLAQERVISADSVSIREELLRDGFVGLAAVGIASAASVMYVDQRDALASWFDTTGNDLVSGALVAGLGGSSALGGLLVSLVRAQLAPRGDTHTRRSRLADLGRRTVIALIELLLLLLVPLAFVAAFVLGWIDDGGLVGWAMLALLGGLLLAMLLGDRALSPHALYRNRLARAFSMVRQQRPDQPRPFVDPSTQGGESAWPVRSRARLVQPRLSALVPRWREDHPAAHADELLEIPELLICASVNISEPGVAAAGSHARPIVFSPIDIRLAGEPSVILSTEAYERAIGRPAGLFAHSFDASVMSYVALTGAAVSPSMGKYTKTWLRSVLTLLNIRLGTWIPNPASAKVQAAIATGELDPGLNHCPGPLLWLRELRGRHYLRATQIYVSDGGHYENLGIVELVRRGCTEIWAVDASDDDRGTWRALSESLNLIVSELGCEVDGDFDRFSEAEPDDPTSRLINQTFADVTVRGLSAGRPFTCVIHVIKLGMCSQTNAVVAQLGAKYRKFPYDSTLNQLYTAERFDLYRSLGFDSAQRALLAQCDSARTLEA